MEALEHGGVYLFSVEHKAGYLVYCAGYTSHFRKRFRQHDKLYRDGTYTIFDQGEFAVGKRVKVWTGFWSKRPRSPEMVDDFLQRTAEIEDATNRWLDGYRVFVARADVDRRIRQRLESALMSAFMSAEPPACDMPDKGMSLSWRWPWEQPIHVSNVSTEHILGLPPKMEA
ncbi:hypothetical protein ABXJ76_00395 [Methylobacter sp. G7]|uniref:hypothetical protein n=1 Tax=Methylobacter sp. G7 TaxID=3230117 RepID=UPI003D80671E